MRVLFLIILFYTCGIKTTFSQGIFMGSFNYSLHNLYAQKITLSAEIIWKKKEVYLLNYDTVDVPFLRFNYKNNTADSIYFYNSLGGSGGSFPEYLNFNYELQITKTRNV